MLSAREGRTDITNVSMWKRLILIQGRKHVRAKKKKEVGGEKETATLPDATVELELKYSIE